MTLEQEVLSALAGAVLPVGPHLITNAADPRTVWVHVRRGLVGWLFLYEDGLVAAGFLTKSEIVMNLGAPDLDERLRSFFNDVFTSCPEKHP